MSSRCIVPVDPADGRGETVVVEVQQEGSHPLDVRLVGCEGESPYVASIQHRNLAKLKHKFKGSDNEWAAVLSHFLLQKELEDGLTTDILEGVRMLYTLKNETLEISFRQDVQTIKVTLGEIILPRDDDFEFNPFDWVQASAIAHAQTLQQMTGLKVRVGSKQKTIAKLNAQLDDFIKTKNETETAMLRQFMELLNEKKRKIRDQNRLLAGAEINQEIATAVQSTRAETKTRKPGASRTCKRKATTQAAEPDLAPRSGSDSDQMEIDQAKVEERDEEMPEPMTPDQSDDETDEEDDAAPQTRARSSKTPKSSSAVTHSSKAEAAEIKGVPPPRALPFTKKTMATRSKHDKKPPLPPPASDEDDETEDEEEL